MQFFNFDADYVRRLKDGDAEVERHFVSYFTELLVIKLRARWLPREVVEDLRQETFARVMAALRREGGIKEPDRLGAFVNSVCNHTLLEFYRSCSRTQALGDCPAESFDRVIDLDGLLVTGETKERVGRVLAQLPRKDSQLLRALFLQDKGKDEVCREFGVDRGYLRVLVHRAKERFKACYLKSEAGTKGQRRSWLAST